jgi:hypothetical protein
MVIEKPAWEGKNLRFSSRADLCKEVSTKGNDKAALADPKPLSEGAKACHPIIRYGPV